MSKHVRDILTMGRRGFTLIELVAVMAILAILVAIVAPAAINSERASISSQAQSDALQVRNAAAEFYTRGTESDVRTLHAVTLTTKVNDVAVTSTQMVSRRWPEMFITEGSDVTALSDRTANSQLSKVFETGAGPKVVNVDLKDKNGVSITGSDFLTKFTAIDAQTLVAKGQLNKLPDGVLKESATGIGTPELKVPNILWLFKKQNSSVGTDDDRVVTVFLLVKVEKIEPSGGGAATTVKLTYQQILGS